MKQCTKCKEWKQFSDFYKNRSRRDGYDSRCKKCANEAQKACNRSEILKRYNASEKGKAAREKYHSTPKGKGATEKYRDSGKYKEITREYRKAYRRQHPDRASAHDKVTDAIRAGKLLPANNYQCYLCKNQAMHYHHDDYSKPLEVKPVCPQCHADIHKAMAQ